MTEENKQCYFRGRYFETPEELHEYIINWATEPLDVSSADITLDSLKKDIIMNVFMGGNRFTNYEFQQYVDEVFELAMKRLGEKE